MSPVIYFTESSSVCGIHEDFIYKDQNIMLGVTVKCFIDLWDQINQKNNHWIFKKMIML